MRLDLRLCALPLSRAALLPRRCGARERSTATSTTTLPLHRTQEDAVRQKWTRPKWSPEDVEKLQQLRSEGNRFASIASTLQRSVNAVTNKYHSILGETRAAKHGKRYFTDAEDKLIMNLRESGALFPDISAALPQPRLPSVIRNRLMRLKHPATAKCRPKGSKGRSWLASDDETLLALRGQQQLSWSEIQTHLPGFSLTSLMTRHNRLVGPRVKHTSRPYTREEDEMLVRLRREGLTWPEVQAAMPSRSPRRLKVRIAFLLGPSKS